MIHDLVGAPVDEPRATAGSSDKSSGLSQTRLRKKKTRHYKTHCLYIRQNMRDITANNKNAAEKRAKQYTWYK